VRSEHPVTALGAAAERREPDNLARTAEREDVGPPVRRQAFEPGADPTPRLEEARLAPRLERPPVAAERREVARLPDFGNDIGTSRQGLPPWTGDAALRPRACGR
jgi:hypothetical protein